MKSCTIFHYREHCSLLVTLFSPKDSSLILHDASTVFTKAEKTLKDDTIYLYLASTTPCVIRRSIEF